MSEQQKGGPKALACPRCGGELVKCQYVDYRGGAMYVRPLGSKVSLWEDHKSSVGAMVCYTCGYLEFIALAPEELDPAQWRDKLYRKASHLIADRLNGLGDKPMEETEKWAEQLQAVEEKLGEAYELLAELQQELKVAGHKKEATTMNEPMERLSRYARLFAEVRGSWQETEGL